MNAMNQALFVDGRWQRGSGAEFSSHSPVDGALLWQAASASADDIEQAMQAARAAFSDWALAPFAQREAICRRFAELLRRDSEPLAQAIARETGKPLWESRTEVTAMIGKIDISVRAWHARTGTHSSESGGVQSLVSHRPHGVVAVYGPYNFPGHLPNGHIVPALLAGNCVLFKPSEQTPLVAERCVQLWQEAGIPAGVLQLLPGERSTGEAIAAHPQLDGLYFTGSSRTGHVLNRQFAETPGRILALEMGGNNPLIVGEYDEIKPVLHDILQSAYLSAGQRCTCARRLFVPVGERGDALVAALLQAAAAIVVGDPLAEPQPFMGPVISAAAAEGLLAAQQRLIAQGAHCLLEMRRLPAGPAYLSPGLLDVSAIVEQMADEEDFGPLLKLVRYTDFDQAIAWANRTRYGLSAALLSTDDAQWQRFYAQIRAGVVNRNRQTTGASSAAPFGGVGASGNHRASAYYAADYCAYPVASMIADSCSLPASLAPGLSL